jgi:hypothetical protein
MTKEEKQKKNTIKLPISNHFIFNKHMLVFLFAKPVNKKYNIFGKRIKVISKKSTMYLHIS